MDFFQFLPSVLWSQIFSYFFETKKGKTELCRLRLVCKSFRSLISPFWNQKLRLIYVRTYNDFENLASSIQILSLSNPTQELLSLPKNFGELFSNLVYLRLHESVLDEIKYLPTSLKKLCFTCNSNFPGISNATLKHLCSYSIVELNLQGHTSISSEGISHLPKTLTSLNLSQCTLIENKAISLLPKSLKELSLNNCIYIGVEGFKNLPKNLKILNLEGTKIDDSGLSQLPAGLIELNLSYCINITNQGLKTLPRFIQILDMEGTRLKNETISYFPPSLKQLSLNYCNNITNEGLKFLPTSLKILSLEGTKIDDMSILLLPNSIVELYLGYCKNITDEGLKNLAHLDKLQKISIFSNRNIYGSAFQHLDINLTVLLNGELLNPFLASVYLGNLESTKYFVEKAKVDLTQTSPSSEAVLNIAYATRNKALINYLTQKNVTKTTSIFQTLF